MVTLEDCEHLSERQILLLVVQEIGFLGAEISACRGCALSPVHGQNGKGVLSRLSRLEIMLVAAISMGLINISGTVKDFFFK